VGNLAYRLEKLERRRQQEAVEEIFRRARAASLDEAAKFLLTREELEPRKVTFAEIERVAWARLGVSLDVVREAEKRLEFWADELGDLLAARRGLLSHMRSSYPGLTRKFLTIDQEEKEG
jgi:hypothetical protein